MSTSSTSPPSRRKVGRISAMMPATMIASLAGLSAAATPAGAGAGDGAAGAGAGAGATATSPSPSICTGAEGMAGPVGAAGLASGMTKPWAFFFFCGAGAEPKI